MHPSPERNPEGTPAETPAESPAETPAETPAENGAAKPVEEPRTRRVWIILLLILLGSTGLKLGLVDTVKDQKRVGDQRQYLIGSRNVYRTGEVGYTFEQWDEAHSSPVYPYGLGYLRHVVPVDTYRPWLLSIQAVISSLTALMTFIIARRCFGPANALWSAGLVAFLPSFIAYSQLFLTETLYTFLFLAVTAILITARDRVSPGRALAAGLVGGITALTKSQFVVLSPLVIIWLLVQGLAKGWNAVPNGVPSRVPSRSAILAVGAYVFGLFLIVAPWSIRNTLRYDHFLMVDSNPGNVLYKNWNAFPTENHDVGLHGSWEDMAANYSGTVPARERSTEENVAVRNNAEVKAAIAFVLAHPMHFLGQCWQRTLALFNPTSFLIRRIREGKSVPLPRFWQEAIVWTTLLSIGSILVFSVIGMTTVKPSVRALLPLLLILGCTVLCVAILSTSRYRFPMLPFLIMFAIDGIRRLPMLLQKPSRGLLLAVPILIVMALAFYRYAPLSL